MIPLNISRKSIHLAKLNVQGCAYIIFNVSRYYISIAEKQLILSKVCENVLPIHSVCLKFSFGLLCIFILQICKIKLYIDGNVCKWKDNLLSRIISITLKMEKLTRYYRTCASGLRIFCNDNKKKILMELPSFGFQHLYLSTYRNLVMFLCDISYY